MTTASEAFDAIRDRIDASDSGISLPLRWQNEDGPELPDVPAAFAFIEFHTDRAYLASFGDGIQQNRWRNHARVDAYVFVPRGDGINLALTKAEEIAARFRGFRDGDISCFDASVRPGTSAADLNSAALGQTTQSVADNYFWALAQVELFFDQIG